jgi:hypothetical protein
MALFACIWFTDRPSLSRSAAAGLLLGAATMVRPYSILLPLAFAAVWVVRRVPAFSPRHVLVVALITWAMVGAWTARNYYCFRAPIVMTSMGLGQGLWLASSATRDWGAITDEWRQLGVVDPHRHDENRILQSAALQGIRGNPWRYAAVCAWNVPRRWVSLGSGIPATVQAVLGAMLSLLLVATACGVWVCRRARQPVLAGSLAIVLYYSLVFIPISPEGRYMVPARPFAFVLASAVMVEIASRVAGRRAPPPPEGCRDSTARRAEQDARGGSSATR